MLEKLLSLLLQAKSGAVATVFVLGASGALVTATVTDGVATITVTPQESSTTSSTTTGNTTTTNSVEQAILALFNRTSAEDDPTSTATGPGCSDEAHERNKWMKEVNDAFKDLHKDVLDLGKDAPKSAEARQLVKDADTDLKVLRQNAVKDIHGTFDCDKDDDDEEDTTSTSTTTTTTDTTAALTGDTAEEIAETAIEEMEKVVEDLEAALDELEESDDDSDEESATTTDAKQKGKSDNKGNKGGNGKGRSR